MDPEVAVESKRKAKAHLGFVVKIYRSQLERGARFLRERPVTANSRGEECAKDLTARPEVQRGVGHMCRFGTTAPAPACAGVGPVSTGARRLPVRKPTRWASSSPEILKRVCVPSVQQ
eukprot:2488603-Alexandrium_andersonii.AAC.1